MALGGEANKEGEISKGTLIDIIKVEFELTIDMEVSAAFTAKLSAGLFTENRW